MFSSSGSMTSAVATSWLVLQLTESPISIALVSALTFLPSLLGGAWAGSVVDRLDARRLLLVTNCVFVVLAAAQTALVATGTVELWMLFVFAVLNGTVLALDNPARQIYVFRLVGATRLASAVGLYEVILNAARAIGPAIGGLLLATAGIAACLAFNGLTYVPTIAVLVMLRPAAEAPPAKAPRRPHDIRAGFAAVRRSPVILSCIAIAGATGMVFNLGTTTSLFATRTLHLGGGGFGALMACFGIGALPGAVMAASSHGAPSPRLVHALTAATAGSVLLTALAPNAASAFAGMVLIGFCSIWLVAAANTLVQLLAAPEVRGRVMGIWSMALPGANPITGLFSGATAQVYPRGGIGLAGVVLFAAVAATWAALRGKAAYPQPAVSQ
ncbi:MFS transporter [Dactylosporangium darangshiense]|uniref:MFS transporter n=1 Tax=Dactylosporangium darangshiense TaxID=579108 RepID=A0ABP8DDY7_9ACTN